MQIQQVSSKQISIQEIKRLTAGRNYLVAWYGGLRKNNVAGSVPNVAVFLRSLDDNNIPTSWFQTDLALTHLGLLRLGSIWQDGELHSQQILPTETFNVDFTPDKWQFISPASELIAGRPRPIDQNDYELRYKFDKNWLINFPLPRGKNLLIPSVEFYCRCYGTSMEVKRVLATYPWYEVENRLYDPFYGDGISDGWHIKLRPRIHKDDAIFLAHMKYDMRTQKKAKSIFAQLETQYHPDTNLMFPQIGPWFEGKAKIRVEGHWINNSKTFLALRVTGCSDPAGEKIYRTRDKKGEDVALPDDPDIKAFPIQRFAPGMMTDVTTTEEPDNPSAWLSVEADDFMVLGKPRTVIDKKVDGGTSKRRFIATSDDTTISKVSSGEAYGKGKGTGTAIVSDRRVLESVGVMRDMWNALLKMKKSNPDTIKSVEWYTFKDGFSSDPEPQCIALAKVDPASEKKYNFPSDAKSWVYVDPYNTRGILVMCIGAMTQTETGIPRKKNIYLIEIERRIRSVKKGEQRDIAEENFKGLVLTLSDDRKLDDTLKQFLFYVRKIKGIVHKLTGRIPGKAYAFKHTPSQNDQFPCEQTIRSALSKVGVKVG